MNKKRSVYQIQLSMDPNQAEQLIQGYLSAKDFVLTERKGEKVYKRGATPIEGARFLTYQIDGTTLTIQAWMMSTARGETSLDASLTLGATIPFRDDITELLDRLSQSPANQPTPAAQSPAADYVGSLKNATNKTRGNYATIAFVLSIIGIVMCFFGITWSLIIYVLIYVLAIMGIKSNKKGLAIVAIAIASVSVVITIVKVITAL